MITTDLRVVVWERKPKKRMHVKPVTKGCPKEENINAPMAGGLPVLS
jgi:hypothetical protein